MCVCVCVCVCVCAQIVYLSRVCTCILGTGSTQWNVLALPVAINFVALLKVSMNIVKAETHKYCKQGLCI